MEENAYIHVNEETLKRIDEKMPPEEELQDLAEFFKVFGDGTRLKILYVLRDVRVRHCGSFGNVPVGDLPPAAGVKADGSGEKPPGGQDNILFSG